MKLSAFQLRNFRLVNPRQSWQSGSPRPGYEPGLDTPVWGHQAMSLKILWLKCLKTGRYSPLKSSIERDDKKV